MTSGPPPQFISMILFEKDKHDIVAMITFQTFGYIWSLAVDAEYRRMGLGKFMVKCTIENMIDMQASFLASLNVNTNNIPAIKLYESCGFSIDSKIGILKGFYQYDPNGPDAYEMNIRVPERELYTASEIDDDKMWGKLGVNEWNLVHRVNGLLMAIDMFCA